MFSQLLSDSYDTNITTTSFFSFRKYYLFCSVFFQWWEAFSITFFFIESIMLNCLCWFLPLGHSDSRMYRAYYLHLYIAKYWISMQLEHRQCSKYLLNWLQIMSPAHMLHPFWQIRTSSPSQYLYFNRTLM